MTSSKHPTTQPQDRPRDDLEDDPGIGQSEGLFATGADESLIEGDSTVEGDVENEAANSGAIPEGHLGRTNK